MHVADTVGREGGGGQYARSACSVKRPSSIYFGENRLIVFTTFNDVRNWIMQHTVGLCF